MHGAGVANTSAQTGVLAAAKNSLHGGTSEEREAEEEAAEEGPSAEEAAQAKAAEIKAKAKAKPKGKGKATAGTDPDTPPSGKPKDPQVVLLSQAKDVKQQRSNVLTACAEIKNLTATHPEWKFASTPAEVETLQSVMDKLQVSNLV